MRRLGVVSLGKEKGTIMTNKEKMKLAEKAFTTGDYKKAAEIYRSCLPKPRKPKGEQVITKRNRKKLTYPFPIAVAEFEDGTVIERSFASLGDDLNVKRATALCNRAYQTIKATEMLEREESGNYQYCQRIEEVRRTINIPSISFMFDAVSGQEMQCTA